MPSEEPDEESKFFVRGVDFSVHDQCKKFCLTKYHAQPTHCLRQIIIAPTAFSSYYTIVCDIVGITTRFLKKTALHTPNRPLNKTFFGGKALLCGHSAPVFRRGFESYCAQNAVFIRPLARRPHLRTRV